MMTRRQISMIRAWTRRIVMAGLICCTFTAVPFAQTSTGGIRGVVRDGTGGSLIGVTVEVGGPALVGRPAVQVTNDQGIYRFERLPVGVYSVAFSLQGFTNLKRENVRVEVGRTIDVDATLAVSAVAETVTVSGAAPVVDSLHSGATTNFNVALIENIPSTRTSWFDTVSFAPAVRTDQQNANNATFILYGSNSDQNSYQFDGIDVGGLSGGIVWDFPSPDIIQELQVVGIGASAEYAGFQGGIVNLVTKSGSNAWRGRSSFFFIRDDMVGSNTPNEPNPFKIDYNDDFTFDIGGPLIRDRLWAFGAYEYYRVHNAQVGVPIGFAPKAARHKPTGKINWAISQKSSFDVSYNQTHYDSPGQTSRTSPANTVSQSIGHQPIVSARWTRIVSPKTVLEVRGGGMFAPSVSVPISGDYTTPGHFDIGTGFRSVNTTSFSRSSQHKYSGSVTMTHHADDFIQGSHDFKFGVQVQPKWTQKTQSTYIGGMFFYDLNGGPNYILTREPASTIGRVTSTGVFVQDDWLPTDRLTLNVGARFDRTVGSIPETDKLDAQFNAVGGTWPGIPDLLSFSNISPRVGFNLKLDRTGKTVGKASYGRYFGRVNTGMFSSASPGNTPTIALLYNTTTGIYDRPFFTTNPNSNYAIDPNLENQYTDQVFVGVEREILPDFGVEVMYVYKKEQDFIRLRDATGVYAAQPLIDTFQDRTQTLTVYNLVTPTSASVFQVMNRDDFRQDYNSVVVQGNKRLSNRWQLLGSYQWQRARGVAGGGVTIGSQAFSSLGPNGFGRDPNDSINAYGRYTSDSAHSVKLNLTVEVPYGVHLGLRESYESGRPYGRAITVRGLRQGNRTVLAEARGAYEMQATNDFQVRVDKSFRLTADRRLRLSLDVVNLFNVETYTQVRNNSSQTGFGDPLAVVSPRRAQLGVRFEF